MGCIKSVSGRAAQCMLANGTTATVALTDLHDTFVSNALQHLEVGAYVRGRVKAHPAQEDSVRMWLSLRQSDGCKHAGAGAP
jgi:cytosine/adenosine deaminase-related metal-dependent hydrolase